MDGIWSRVSAVLTIAILPGLVSAQPPASPSAIRETGFEVLARLDKQPEHVAVTPEGRIIVSLSEIDSPDMALAEVKKDGELVPYPSKEAAGPRTAKGGFVNIVALASNNQDLIGVIDIGDTKQPGQVVVIDTKANAVQRTIPLPPRQKEFRFVQDLEIDGTRKCVYMAGHDRGGKTGALIVFDFASGGTRVFPINNPRWSKPSMATGAVPEAAVTSATVESVMKGINLPLSLDPTGTWLYFAGLAGDTIFRVPAADLADPQMTADVLATKVEQYGDKPIGASMVADEVGRVFVTDENEPGIGVFWQDRGYRVIAKDTKLYWPYGLTRDPSGQYLYVTVNRLRAAAIKGDISRAPREPYVIARVKVPPPEF